MATEDEIKLAESEYNVALVALNKCPAGKPGFGAEAKYGQAYQRLVQYGLRPQINLKYRGA